MKRLTAWLASMPSTNTRIAVTLLCVFGTACRYWASASWVPDAGWLTFLAAMSGIDAVQFYGKRVTQNGGGSPPSAPSSEDKG